MVGKNSNFSFIKGFCMAIPYYQGNDTGAVRKDYYEVPYINKSPINAHICMHNVSAVV